MLVQSCDLMEIGVIKATIELKGAEMRRTSMVATGKRMVIWYRSGIPNAQTCIVVKIWIRGMGRS